MSGAPSSSWDPLLPFLHLEPLLSRVSPLPQGTEPLLEVPLQVWPSLLLF